MTEKYVNKVIVILGASFAGMTCAQKLRQLNPNWDIVLIDMIKKFIQIMFQMA